MMRFSLRRLISCLLSVLGSEEYEDTKTRWIFRCIGVRALNSAHSPHSSIMTVQQVSRGGRKKNFHENYGKAIKRTEANVYSV